MARTSSSSISGAAARGPRATEASGMKINAAPKPEKPRARPPASAAASSQISAAPWGMSASHCIGAILARPPPGVKRRCSRLPRRAFPG